MLKKLPGVLTVKADHRDQKVRLTVDPEQTTAQALRERLAAIGYDTD
jgi:copper chaperone CopZ